MFFNRVRLVVFLIGKSTYFSDKPSANITFFYSNKDFITFFFGEVKFFLVLF